MKKINLKKAFWNVVNGALVALILILMAGVFLRALDFSFWLQGR